MSDKLATLIRMITVIQARPGISANELQKRCEIDERKLYRYLNTLSTTVPIQIQGYNKGYRFMGNFSIYPLDLTIEEATAFAWLQPMFNELKDTPIAIHSAYEKIMASITKEKKIRKDMAERVNEIFRIGKSSIATPKTNYLEKILQAIMERRTIEATYHTQSRDQTTTRKIDPYYLIPRENRFYLIAYCHTNQTVRTFRISRFKNIKLVPLTFSINDFNIDEYMRNTWSIERGDQLISFKIKFSSTIARYIKEEELFVKPKISELADGSLLFEVKVNSDREFLQWLNQYGADAEILEPKKYREAQIERLKDWLRVYEGRGNKNS